MPSERSSEAKIRIGPVPRRPRRGYGWAIWPVVGIAILGLILKGLLVPRADHFERLGKQIEAMTPSDRKAAQTACDESRDELHKAMGLRVDRDRCVLVKEGPEEFRLYGEALDVTGGRSLYWVWLKKDQEGKLQRMGSGVGGY